MLNPLKWGEAEGVKEIFVAIQSEARRRALCIKLIRLIKL